MKNLAVFIPLTLATLSAHAYQPSPSVQCVTTHFSEGQAQPKGLPLVYNQQKERFQGHATVVSGTLANAQIDVEIDETLEPINGSITLSLPGGAVIRSSATAMPKVDGGLQVSFAADAKNHIVVFCSR